VSQGQGIEPRSPKKSISNLNSVGSGWKMCENLIAENTEASAFLLSIKRASLVSKS